MAKIVITIEDNAAGGVKVVCDPNFETMMQRHISGHQLTSAHGYALAALNSIRQKSKENGSQMKIILPRRR